MKQETRTASLRLAARDLHEGRRRLRDVTRISEADHLPTGPSSPRRFHFGELTEPELRDKTTNEKQKQATEGLHRT